MEEKKNKYAEKINQGASGMLVLAYLVTFILIIIWLFKLLHNTKSEPSNRNIYITKDPSNFYIEGEFCYDNYEAFIIKGALDTFDIPIKKIKKYTKALLATIIITICTNIISTILLRLYECNYSDKDWLMTCGIIFYFLFTLALILSIVFAIILAHYYFKGNYNDFEEFSRCRYLTKYFRTDYNFIFKIKNEFKMPFVLILLTEFFNFVKLIAEK